MKGKRFNNFPTLGLISKFCEKNQKSVFEKINFLKKINIFNLENTKESNYLNFM